MWAGLYAVAAFCCVLQLSGLASGAPVERATLAGLAVMLTTAGAYGLDRVKLRDAWIDPADVLAQPRRYGFLTRHSRSVRALALTMLAAGAAAGLAVSIWAPLASLAAAAGVLAYALKPRAATPRLKDRLLVKNAYVAVGMTGFAALASIAAARTPQRLNTAALAAACGVVLARVWLDAALCDIDDEATDRANRTGTLPTSIGSARTWTLTGVLRVAVITATLACVWCPLKARIAWSAAGTAGLLLLRFRRPSTLRDVVDLRFAAEATVATTVLWLGS
jgi:4-hydroxybenzoate polyprenyltransferase